MGALRENVHERSGRERGEMELGAAEAVRPNHSCLLSALPCPRHLSTLQSAHFTVASTYTHVAC